jgi:hypothetical protein
MLNMYNATERLVTVGEESRSTATRPSEAAANGLADNLAAPPLPPQRVVK